METTFASLNLQPETMQALADLDYTYTTPIQAQSIPHLQEGRDLIGQAQTGTGKTIAFAIPAIERTDTSSKETQTLILCPTRELAMQVEAEIAKLTTHNRRIRSIAIYGGASIDKQIQGLRRGAHIVVGTPGRIMDHLDRGTLQLGHVREVILDEADEMLDMGFREDIESILTEVPKEGRQTVFFSATMSKSIMDLTKRYQKDPVIIKVAKDDLTVAAIQQSYYEVREREKMPTLTRLIDLYEPRLCLVFCNTKRKVDELVENLQREGFMAEALHGDLRQGQRIQVLSKFKEGVIQILVATDVAARGIDIYDMEMVVNFDLPPDLEYYVHRIGRTGRAGRSGRALSLVTMREVPTLRAIERVAKVKIPRETPPSAQEVEAKKRNKFLNHIKTTIDEGGLSHYLDWVENLRSEGYTAADVAAALIKIEVHTHASADTDRQPGKIEKKERGDDRRADRSDRGDRPERRDRKSEGGSYKSDPVKEASSRGMTRLFLGLGKKDQLAPKDIVGAIAGESGIEGRDIGNIDLFDMFSFVEVPSTHAEMIIRKMSKITFKGKPLKISLAEGR